MKNTYLIVALAILCSCNLTNKQKAENLVKNCLKDRLKDPDSYQPIVTEVDTLYTGAFDVKEYSVYSDSVSKIGTEISDVRDDIYATGKIDEKKINKLRMDSLRYARLMSSIEDTVKHRPNGWMISQRYRAKNSFGGYDIYDVNVRADKNFTEGFVIP
ncbi:MAG: hypothetical protein V4577_20840 [Bacteroidota bacterium]